MRLQNIEVLRAFAIIYMLLYHYANSITGFVKNYTTTLLVESLGQFALIGFFVLSGFGIYLSFQRLETDGKELRFIPFIKKRLRALIPQYYFCIGTFLLLTTGIGYLSKNHIFHIIESLLLIQNFDIANSINGVTWTIAVLFQLYLISILLYRLVKKYGLWAWGIGLFITICLKKGIATYIAMNEMDPIYYVITSIRIPFTTVDLILSGMCAAKICHKIPAKMIQILKKPQMSIACISLVLVYHYIFIKGTLWIETLYGNKWSNCVWQSAIGGYLAIICILLYYLPFTYTNKLGRGIQFMAKYEYGIYLWHMLLMGNFMNTQPDWYAWLQTNSPIALLIILLGGAIFVGWISSKLTSSKEYLSLFILLE